MIAHMVEGEFGDNDDEDLVEDEDTRRMWEERYLRLHPLADRPFSEAWLRAIGLFGERPRYFINSGRPASQSFRAWPPDVALIKKDLEELPSSDAIFLAAMVSFFNGDTGGKLLRGLGASGLSNIAVSLDDERRQLLADLLVRYPGW